MKSLKEILTSNAVEVTQAKKNTEALCLRLREIRMKKLKNAA